MDGNKDADETFYSVLCFLKQPTYEESLFHLKVITVACWSSTTPTLRLICLLHLWSARTAGYPQIIRRRHTFVSICNTIPQAYCNCDNRAAPSLAQRGTPVKPYWPRPANTSVWWRPQAPKSFIYRTTRHCEHVVNCHRTLDDSRP